MLTTPTFLMVNNASIKPFLGTTPSGPSFGSIYNSVCRFESYRKRFLDSSEKAFFSNGKVFLPPTQANIDLQIESLLTIDSKQYKIIEKQIMRGFAISHIECVVI